MAEAVVTLLNSLERAIHLTKCLPSATTQDQVSAVYSSLRDAQLNIQNFLLLNQQEEEVVATMDENNEDCLREQEMQEDAYHGRRGAAEAAGVDPVLRSPEQTEETCAFTLFGRRLLRESHGLALSQGPGSRPGSGTARSRVQTSG